MGNFATTTSLAIIMVGTTWNSTSSLLADKCCDWAEAEVRKYVNRRYSTIGWTTTAATPPLIVSLADRLAEGYFYKQTSRGGKDAMERGQNIIDDVIKNLEMLRDHKVDLCNTAGSLVTELDIGMKVQCSTEDYNDTFNEGDPANWHVDDDKIDDIGDE